MPYSTFVGTTWQWSLRAIFSYLRDLCQGKQDKHFGVLLVGETGTGKSTLINNLVGKDMVEVGNTFSSETDRIIKLEMEVEGVPVVLYDTPGLNDTRCDRDKEHLHEVKKVLDDAKIHLVIYCLKLTETRMRGSLKHTFQEYSKIGVNWEQAIIAFTFADVLPVPSAERKKPDFDIGTFFDAHVSQWHDRTAAMLEQTMGVDKKVARKMKFHPTTSNSDDKLVNGKEWFVPLWLDVLELLSPGAAVQFLEMHSKNIESGGAEGGDSPVIPDSRTIQKVVSPTASMQCEGLADDLSTKHISDLTCDITITDKLHQPITSSSASPQHAGANSSLPFNHASRLATGAPRRSIILKKKDEQRLREILTKKTDTVKAEIATNS